MNSLKVALLFFAVCLSGVGRALASQAASSLCIDKPSRRCGLLDQEGNWIVYPLYKAPIKKNGPYWILKNSSNATTEHWILDRDGRRLLEQSFLGVGLFSEELFPVKVQTADRTEKWGYIDVTGKFVIEPQFKEAGPFIGGLAVVEDFSGDDNRTFYIDKSAKNPFSFKAFALKPFANELSTGILKKGEYLIDIIFNRKGKILERYSSPYAGGVFNALPVGTYLKRNSKTESHELKKADGTVLIGLDKKINFYDHEQRYSYFLQRDMWGLADLKQGTIVFPASKKYDSASNYAKDCWVVSDSKGRYGCLKLSGEWLIKPQFSGLSHYRDDYFEIVEKGKVGLLGPEGKIIIPPIYISRENFDDGYPGYSFVPSDFLIMDKQASYDQNYEQDVFNLNGEVIARRENHECGFQLVKNKQGQVIWPKNIKAMCHYIKVADQETKPEPADDIKVALNEILREEMIIESKSLGSCDLEQFFRATENSNAPQDMHEVVVGPHLAFKVPKEYRLEQSEEDKKYGRGYLVRADGCWTTRFQTFKSGRLSEAQLFSSPEQLLSTAEIYARRGPIGSSEISVFSWIIEPKISTNKNQISWAFYKILGLGGGYSEASTVTRSFPYAALFTSHDFGSSVSGVNEMMTPYVLKSQASIEMRSISGSEAELSIPEVNDWSTFITGPPSEAVIQIGKAVQRMEEKKWEDFWARNAGRIGQMLALLGAFLGTVTTVRKIKNKEQGLNKDKDKEP